MLKVPDFTKPEIDYIKENGNLTSREAEILELRNNEYPPTIENIAEMWGCSSSTVNRTIKGLKRKILRLIDKGL